MLEDERKNGNPHNVTRVGCGKRFDVIEFSDGGLAFREKKSGEGKRWQYRFDNGDYPDYVYAREKEQELLDQIFNDLNHDRPKVEQ